MSGGDQLDVALEHHRSGRVIHAEATYREVLTSSPDDPSALHLLGMLCHQLGRDEEALPLLRRSIELLPSASHFHSNIAGVLGRCGRPNDALPHLREAIRLQPDLPQARNNLGVALESLGQLSEAESEYREAMRLNPSYAEACCNLGNVLKKRGELRAAASQYRRALDLAPDFVDALTNLGYVLGEMGQVGETSRYYRRAVSLQPDSASTHSALLFTLHYDPEVDAQQLFSEHAWWGERHAAPLRRCRRPHENSRAVGRRLRVGYVSPDFRAHPVSRFFEPILRAHDRRSLHVTCYSDVKEPDAITQMMRGLPDVWREIRGITDERLAELIRQDRIDILVDLAGHLADHRLLMFARKPAPVQVTYLGYPDTTGVSAIGYRITDSIHDPPGETDRYHTEQLVRVDPCCWCYQPDDPDAPTPPEAPPLTRNGYVTFACLNRLVKVTPVVARLWGEIMRKVPNSRLVVLAEGHDGAADDVRGLLGGHGINPASVDVAGRIGRDQYMNLYREVDVALDTFPYNGHTTTCDALWMGVPTVTLAGETHVARAGKNVLTQVALPDLVATTPEDYVAIAVALAHNQHRLSELRVTLRDRMRKSPLRDGQSLTSRIERAYLCMWQHWCSDTGRA
jgi:protein O-GlcNAc transferase